MLVLCMPSAILGRDMLRDMLHYTNEAEWAPSKLSLVPSKPSVELMVQFFSRGSRVDQIETRWENSKKISKLKTAQCKFSWSFLCFFLYIEWKLLSRQTVVVDVNLAFLYCSDVLLQWCCSCRKDLLSSPGRDISLSWDMHPTGPGGESGCPSC